MTSRERAAYNAGVEAVRQAALIIASTIEAQDGSQGPRQQAAIAALQALAEGARNLMLLEPPITVPAADLRTIDKSYILMRTR